MKRYIVPLIIILMWAGLLWSRVLLSLSMIAFIGYALIWYGMQGWEEVKRSQWLQGLMLLFFIPLLGFFWSDDKMKWLEVMQDKLPFLLFPFTVPLFRLINQETRLRLLLVLCCLVLLTIGYSYASYFFSDAVNENYLKAKVLRVAMGDDHVRYSSLLVAVYAWVLYESLSGSVVGTMKYWAIGFLVFLAVFFHVLAARTGLAGFYVVSLVAVMYFLKGRVKLIATAVILALPLIAWYVLPSFQNRIKFLVWDFQNFSRGSYVEGLSDTPRMLSLRAGIDLLKANLVKGVGSGDLYGAMHEWYAAHAGYLKDYEKLLPSSELLVYAAGSGLPGGLLALIIFLWPFTIRRFRKNMLWISFHLFSVCYFLYEIPLELQFGVFVYLFFGTWFYVLASGETKTG